MQSSFFGRACEALVVIPSQGLTANSTKCYTGFANGRGDGGGWHSVPALGYFVMRGSQSSNHPETAVDALLEVGQQLG